MDSILTFRTPLVAQISVGLFLVMAVAPSAFSQDANKGRPEKIVQWKMKHLPKGLVLQPKQRDQLQKVFLVAARKEQAIVLAGGGSFNQRVKVRSVSLELMAQERKILSSKQYHLLEGRAANQ